MFADFVRQIISIEACQMSNISIGNLNNNYFSIDFAGKTDPTDTYNFGRINTGSFRVTAEGFSSGVGMQLLDSQGKVIKDIATNGTNSGTFSIDNLGAASYALKISAPSRDTNYQISLTPDGKVDPLTGLGVDSGFFAADATGQVGFDWLQDGGSYQGEVAIFSVQGMEKFTPGSEEFIKEAARRALTNSTLGHVVISDPKEGANPLFDGLLGEANYNSGPYSGSKKFGMQPGEAFVVMLVPNGTVQKVFENPGIGGDKRPLFSLSSTNPSDAWLYGQIADVTGSGKAFAMEDQRVDSGSDKDYNDLVFNLTGATGKAVSIDKVINPDKDWIKLDGGKKLIDYVKSKQPVQEPPVVVTPPVETKPPVAITPPVETKPPVAITPPVETKPPVTVEPPVATIPPVETKPPVTVEPPVATIPPVETKPPVAVTPPVETKPPVAVEPPVATTPPVEPKPPAAVEPPVATTPPVETKPPVATIPPVESKLPVEEPIAPAPPIALPMPVEPPAIEPQRPPIEQPPTDTIPPESDPPVEIDLPISSPVENRAFIGIIDTGFAAKNPDLDYTKVTLGRDRIDKDSDPLLNPGQENEHGTFSWGLVSAIQGNDKGIDGYNDKANIYLSRAIGSGEWDLALTDFVTEAKAQKKKNAIALLPLDLTQKNADGSITTRYEFTPRERAALENARQNGVLLVVAAGNDGGVMSVLGQSSQEFENIITVGASDGFGRSDYSSYGYGLDILVPGGAIDNPTLSTVGDDLGTMAGTSVSAAIAAGMASKVWESNPDLSVTQVIDVLTGSAIDLNAPGWDEETGFGVVNLNKAVAMAKETTPQAYIPTPFSNPTTWGLEGQVTPLERATADEFNGKYYEWVPYTIPAGMVLSQIALDTMGDASAEAYNWIAQYNGIPNPDEIYAGDTIYVPKEVAAPQPSDPGPSDPGPSDPGPSDPGPSDPGPSDPDPVITDPGPVITDPGPVITDPGPTQPPNSINLNGYTISGNFYPVFQNYQGTLGNPISGVNNYNGASYQLFENGSIVSSANGTFPLYGGIRQTYRNTGGLEGWLGAPTSEEKGLGNGNIIQYFENGYIYWNGSKAIAYKGEPQETPTVQKPNNTPIQSSGSGANSPILTAQELANSWQNWPEYSSNNPFPYKGQNCTWYAHGRMLQLGYSKTALDTMWGNAGTWDDTAGNGATVSNTPQAPSIAVWEIGVGGAGDFGHVAVVERVNPDGSILISESNWADTQYNTRTISPGDSHWPSEFVIVPRDSSSDSGANNNGNNSSGNSGSNNPDNGYSPIPGVIPPPEVSISSVSNLEDGSSIVLKGKSIVVSGNSNTQDMEFYIGNNKVGGSLDYLTDGAFTAKLNIPSDLQLGSYAVKIVAKNQPGLTNTFYSNSGIKVVVADDQHQHYIGQTNDGTNRYQKFKRINSPGYIESKPTWVVIHGWNGESNNFEDLAKAIEEYDGYQVGDQVLTLDWDAARTGWGLDAAATWIETVATKTAEILKSWGISSSEINLVGHSLGTYISYEISEELGGINKLVALAPASTTLGGYPNRPNVDFSKYSQWSWAFYGNPTTDSADQTRTADESFEVDFKFSNPDGAHGGGKSLWTNMLRDKNGSISKYFGLEDMNTEDKPWYIDNPGKDSQWEAKLWADDTNGFGSNADNWVAVDLQPRIKVAT
jgi:surface antigen/pimeloyl-ACP methyl ester carboxylesterase